MQALKTLVIALGALIVVGVGLLGWGFYNKLHETAPSPQSTPPASAPAASAPAASAPAASAPLGEGRPAMPPFPPPQPGNAMGEVRVPLPAGCTAVEMRPAGDRLYVRTGPVGLCERILIIDAGTGRLLGDIVLAP